MPSTSTSPRWHQPPRRPTAAWCSPAKLREWTVRLVRRRPLEVYISTLCAAHLVLLLLLLALLPSDALPPAHLLGSERPQQFAGLLALAALVVFAATDALLIYWLQRRNRPLKPLQAWAVWGLCGHDHHPRRLAPHQVGGLLINTAFGGPFCSQHSTVWGMGRRRVPIRRELAAGRGCVARYRRGNRPCGYDRHCRGGGRRGTSSGRGGTSGRRCRQQRSRSLIVRRVGRRTCTANEAVVDWPACTRARQGQSRQEQQQGQCGQPDRTRHGAGRARRW